MSIFKKIKKGLGIGTAKVSLRVSDPLSKDAEEIRGTVFITAKSDQNVKSIKINFEKTTWTETGEDKEEETEVLESMLLEHAFEIKQGEEKAIDFTMPLQFNKPGTSTNIMGVKVRLGDSNPLEDGLFAPMTTRFDVVVIVDLEDVAIDPTAKEPITIT